MPKIYFSKDQIEVAIESLEDYIGMVTRQHEENGLTNHLHTALIDTVNLLEVFKDASQASSTQ